MISCDTCFVTLALVSAFLVVSTNAQSWDFAAVIGEEINFFSRNGTMTDQRRVAGAQDLRALAYDNVTKTMFVSESDEENNVAIYSVNLGKTESEPYSMLNQTNNTRIMAMVFDPVNRTLYWTDNQKKTVMKMQAPLNEDPSSPEILHNLTGRDVWGITLDICNRNIYWSSCADVCIIERSKLDGSDKKVIATGASMYFVYGLAIDHLAEKLYWIDDVPGFSYEIWRSDLDGTNRELYNKGQHLKPFYIAVDNETVYWTDVQEEAIWKVEKDTILGSRTLLKSYFRREHRERIRSVLTQHSTGGIDCKDISKSKGNSLNNPTTPLSEVESFTNPTTSTDEINSTTLPKKNCMNKGRYNELTTNCNCEKGYTGEFCEVSLCHNYCLHGSCALDDKDSPVCDCRGTVYTGDRCERDVCDGYRLKNGTCSVSTTTLPKKNCMNKGRYNELTSNCNCEKGYTGEFCEVSLCHNYCLHGSCALDDKDSPVCDCRGTVYTGDRCERDVCDGYRLKNGTCLVSSTGPYCKCENSQETQCECINVSDELCSLYCTGTEDVLKRDRIPALDATCKCSERNETSPQNFIATEQSAQSTIILSVLVTVIGSLVIVVGFLSYHVNKLRRRPRIRKRFVVSKGGVTPLTSRPQVPADSCEITIENCCNMNICETPCFEPKLRATPTKSSTTKVEEKNSLLDDMEGADSC